MIKSEWNIGRKWTFKHFSISIGSERDPYWGGVTWPTCDVSSPFRWTWCQVNFYVSNIHLSVRFVKFKTKIPSDV